MAGHIRVQLLIIGDVGSIPAVLAIPDMGDHTAHSRFYPESS